MTYLKQNIDHLTASEPTPNLWNGTIGTAIVAPFGYFYISGIRRCGQQTLALEVKAVAEPTGSVVVDSDLDEEPLKIAVTRL